MNKQIDVSGVTELEGMALSMVCERGSMSAYDIKNALETSPSSFWSGSAGAVYPLTKRLEERGFLYSVEEGTGNRPRKVFRLTDAGLKVMQAWVLDVEKATDSGYDPLQSRLVFMYLMPEDKKEAFLDSVEARLHQRKLPKSAPTFIKRLHKSWVSARKSWIATVRETLLPPGSNT